MFLFESIRKNRGIFSYHVNIWLLKVSFVFLAFTPLFNDHNCITYLSQMLLHSNTYGVVGVFNSTLVEFPVLLATMVSLVGLFLFFVDAIFEAGFLNVFTKEHKKYFWASVNEHAKKTIRINAILSIPALITYSLMLFSYNYFSINISSPFSPLALTLVFTILFYSLKIIDSTKLSYTLLNKSLKEALFIGLKNLSVCSKQSWLLNLFYGICLTLTFHLFIYIENKFLFTTSSVVIVTIIVQQVFVFIRQFGRYTYLGAIISSEFSPVLIPQHKMDQLLSREAHSLL
jgi:hypothetical protein